MSTPHLPVMPNKPTEDNARQTPNAPPVGQTPPAPKSAIASAVGQPNLEHLTREIVHEIISKRLKPFADRETLHQIISKRVEKFINFEMVQGFIANRTDRFTDPTAVHKLITERTSHLIERATVHRILGERLAPLVNRETVHELISERQANQAPPPPQRPMSWEDDISVNTLDEEPFETLPSPKSCSVDKFVEAATKHGDRETLAKVDIAQLVGNDDIPIPVPDDREGYFSGFDEKYWLFGLADYLKVMESAAKYDVQPNSVLDFGCASGRVLRHFAAQSKIKNVWGSDINRRHIRWLYEHMPMQVRPVFNHCIPSLPIPDASIDIITAFSVFTHIDTFEIHWLAELSRILSDTGICYLTVHNEDTWGSLAEDEKNPDNRLIQSLIKIDPRVADQLQHPMPGNRLVYRFADQGPYRAQVFLSNRHLETVWGRFFSIKEIIPRHHQRQTVVVLKKRR